MGRTNPEIDFDNYNRCRHSRFNYHDYNCMYLGKLIPLDPQEMTMQLKKNPS